MHPPTKSLRSESRVDDFGFHSSTPAWRGLRRKRRPLADVDFSLRAEYVAPNTNSSAIECDRINQSERCPREGQGHLTPQNEQASPIHSPKRACKASFSSSLIPSVSKEPMH